MMMQTSLKEVVRYEQPTIECNGSDFECPVCQADQFTSVALRRSNGTKFQASFFRCSRCDFAFMDVSPFRRKLKPA